METIQNTSIAISKSDEDFEQQHRSCKQKVLAILTKHHAKCSDVQKTPNHLSLWYTKVEQRKKLIKQLRTKSKTRKCTLLERDFNKEEGDIKTNMLMMARNKRCASLQEEYRAIPKYIKENELLLRSCKKKVHKDCIETYFKGQLQINNALHLQNWRKYPSFDELIVIGKKIEPLICMTPTSPEVSCEEIIEESSEADNELDCSLRSECQFPLIFCPEIKDSKDLVESVIKPKYHCEYQIENFFKKSIAVNIVNDIFNLILNDIFKQNVFFLKMKFSSRSKAGLKDATSNEIDENEFPMVGSSASNLLKHLNGQKKTMIKTPEKLNSDCSFTRSSDNDYMLNYIQNKIRTKAYGMDHLSSKNRNNNQQKDHACLDDSEELKKQNIIKTYWSHMFLIMLDKVCQIEMHIMVTNGFVNKNSSKTNSKSNSSISKNKSNRMNKALSNARSQDPLRSIKQKKSSIISDLEKLLQDQIRNSLLFKSMLYKQFHYLLLDGIDYLCDVLETTF